MRHRTSRGRFNRFTSWRQATLKSLLKALFTYERINTTLVRAKAVQPLADRLIARAKEASLAGRRDAFRQLNDHALVKRLFDEIGPRFKDRAQGYTRILKLGMRRGDNASLVLLELTEIKEKEKKARPAKEARTERPEAAETPAQPAEPQLKEKADAKGPKQERPSPEKTKAAPQKPPKKFLGGIRNIFKKERDSL